MKKPRCIAGHFFGLCRPIDDRSLLNVPAFISPFVLANGVAFGGQQRVYDVCLVRALEEFGHCPLVHRGGGELGHCTV
jgi:hypothetical protein